MAPYLHLQTAILKNFKSHNPAAQSGFISFSWLYLFDYSFIMSQLPWCSPSLVLLKSSFVDSSFAVFCCFSVRICQLTWRWVDFYTSMAFYPPRHHLTYAHSGYSSSVRHNLRHHKLNTPISHNNNTIGEVNNIDHLIVMQCSAGKPQVLYSCGCYSDTYHQPEHCCRPSTPFHGNVTPWQQCLPPAGQCALLKQLRNFTMTHLRATDLTSWMNQSSGAPQ